MASGITQTFPFSNPLNYTYDSSKIEVSGGKAQLKLLQTAQNFNEPFTSDTGFTYDSAKAEFTGGLVRQKDQDPNNLLSSNFSVNQNATKARGSSSGTLFNGATVSSGVLNLPSTSDSYLQYSGASNTPPGSTGCVNFTFTPNFTGAPGANRYLYVSSAAEDNIANMIRIMIVSGTSLIRWDLYDSSGVSIKTVQTGNTITLTAGVPREIELNFDTSAGQYRLYIDRTLVNGLQTSGAGTRTDISTIMRVGKDYTSATSAGVDGTIDNLAVYDSVQHTGASYSPVTVPEYFYASSNVTLPEFTHSLLGNILSYTSFVTTETTAPRYTVKVGSNNYKYWNGSSWSDSDGTYSQASSKSDTNTNIPSLTAETTTTTIRVHFDDSNTRSSVDDLTLNYLGESAYPVDNPTIKPASVTNTSELCSLAATINESGSDAIKFAFILDGTESYWNGSAWAANSSSYANTNTAAELTDVVMQAASVSNTAQPVVYIHSDSGSTTPDIDSMALEYNYNPPSVSETKVAVYGYLHKPNGSVLTGATVSAKPEELGGSDVSKIQYPTEAVTDIVDSVDGSWSLNLVPLVDTRYIFTFTIGTNIIKERRYVSGELTVAYEDLD